MNLLSSSNINWGTPVFKILDGAIALAIDAVGIAEGNYSQLKDYTGESNIAACTHPDVVLHIFKQNKHRILGKHGEYSITRCDMKIGSDYVHVYGQAKEETAEVIYVDYSVKARINLLPGYIEIDVFETDIDLPWWLYAFGIFIGFISIGSGGVIGAAIFTIIATVSSLMLYYVDDLLEDMLRENLDGALSEQRTHQFDLPGTSSVRCKLDIEDLQLGDSGLTMLSSLEIPGSGDTYIEGPRTVKASESQIKCSLCAEEGLYNYVDPDVKIHWKAVRSYPLEGSPHLPDPDNEVVLLDGLSPTGRYLTIQNDYEAFDHRICAHVYRNTLWGETITLANISHYVYTTNRMSDEFRFVRWQYGVYIPAAKHRVDNSVYMGRYQWVERKSAIHITDPSGRCRFADQWTQYIREPSYFDEMPFPRENLEEHRHELCEYCFFGGTGQQNGELVLDPWQSD